MGREGIEVEKVVIYGAGNNCTVTMSALINARKYEISGIADKDKNKQGRLIYGYPVLGPEDMANIDFNYIIISVENTAKVKEIKDDLVKWEIPVSKIIHIWEIAVKIKPVPMIYCGSRMETGEMQKQHMALQNKDYYKRVYQPERKGESALTIAFIVPAPIYGSGGHRNIFRSVSFLKKRGYDVTVYYTQCAVNADIVKWQISEWFYDMRDIPFICYDGSMGVHDVCIATWWETAYVMMDHKQNFKYMFHYVQDNEASFHPMSSSAILAENSYRQDYKYICSGPWMKAFLQNRYHARAECFQFPVNREIYNRNSPRKKKNRNVIFFAKPELPRRCYEIGIAALEEVSGRMPEVEIILFGSDNVGEVPFPVKKLGILPTLNDLADLYRNADLGICFAPTNPSLVPYEMMHCGCPVADIDYDDALLKYGNNADNVFLVDINPKVMGRQICEILQNEKLIQKKREHGWEWANKEFPSEDEMGQTVERIILDEISQL